MLCVFLRQQSFICRNAPINGQAIIYDAYATISFWMVELVTLVLEYGRFAQHGKSVCEATGYKELAVIILGQFYSHMLAVSRTSFANVNSNIKH